MRSDQFMGLPIEALEYIHKNLERGPVCECCKRPFPVELKVIGHFDGMFMDVYNLYEHQLKDGFVAVEFLQAEPWSGGPCFFIGLRVHDADGSLVRTFEHPQDEIENC